MSIYASMPGIDQDAPCGEPWLYRGSHVLPTETDPRGGTIDLASIPSHITRDGRDDRPEDGAPWPWLRLSVHAADDDPTVVINPAQARELARQLTDWADDAEPAHDGGHTGACDAVAGQRGPAPADDATGAQTPAQGCEMYRAAFQRLLPEGSWHLARALADTAAGIAAQATRAEVLHHELLRLLDMNLYVSTACDTAGACETATHDQVDDADQLHDQAVRLHTRCRRTHKFTGAPCACDCHHQPASEETNR